MNNTIYCDAAVSDHVRRERLYDGQIFVYSRLKSVLDFAQFARSMIEEAFCGLDPRTAQRSIEVERYAEILGRLKPAFIHHPDSKRLLQNVIEDLGCDLEQTYFDVPRMRTATSDGYLTTGIAHVYQPHRDTWCSAPPCQINWWMPIYEIDSDNSMAFHPRYWAEPVKNSSAGYNYDTWNKLHRGEHIVKLVREDQRPFPRATEPMELDPQIRVICPVGGIILFSAQQMHSSVPNTSGVTRFSIDFRTVHSADALTKRGAPNVDSECTGTTMRDFLRGTDLSRMPEHIAALYDDGAGTAGSRPERPPNILRAQAQSTPRRNGVQELGPP